MVEHGAMTVVSVSCSRKVRKVRKVAFHRSLGKRNVEVGSDYPDPCSHAALANCSVNSREHFGKLIRLARPHVHRFFS